MFTKNKKHIESEREREREREREILFYSHFSIFQFSIAYFSSFLSAGAFGLSAESKANARSIGIDVERAGEPDRGRESEYKRVFPHTVNLMFHCWLYPDFDMFRGDRPRRGQVECGVFEADGASEHPSCADPVMSGPREAFSGAPFGKLGKRDIFVHDISFSPENNQIVLDPAEPVASFFSVGRSNLKPFPIVTLHVLAMTEAEDDRLQALVAACSTLREVLSKLESLPGAAFKRLHHKMSILVSI